MDLCGPMRVQSINGKKYILVIVDDYSRFTWVKFLRSKDETPAFVINLLKQLQVGLNKTIRSFDEYFETTTGDPQMPPIPSAQAPTIPTGPSVSISFDRNAPLGSHSSSSSAHQSSSVHHAVL
ncbi:integrase, catalytic region, zinc finger, CCHC-type containing protein [Tanacetum coccineum]|uniref:Integrase, catalytic region, zinc finger, CCHC-type containing protein n=1 Tax=Tanacetum coccineum TaxID=301880 RepID=A0ABQ5F0J5_9ASTR